MMSGILGTRLRRERESLGITQESLSRAVGLSSEFISLLELGKRMPSLESLTALAEFFKKDVSYFLKEKEESFNVLFQDKRVDKKARTALKRFKKYCEEYMYLEDLTGRRVELAPLYTQPSAERMADEERRRLGFGFEPIRDIFTLLELNGLRVLRMPIPEESKISGVLIYFEAERAAFALINSAQPFERQAFTAAHEYCHYLKDRNIGPIIDHPDIFVGEYLSLYHPRERFAQTFTVRFLIPPAKVGMIVDKDIHSKNLCYADVLYLQEHFGVSTPDMLQTLKDLEYIPISKYEEFLKLKPSLSETAFFNNQDKGSQPSRGKRGIIPSRRFRSLALEAYQKRKINEEMFAKLLNLKAESIKGDLRLIRQR